jgi:hypothetical protein
MISWLNDVSQVRALNQQLLIYDQSILGKRGRSCHMFPFAKKINELGTYADDIRANRNRDGLFDDFNDTVNDFFGREND